MAKMDDHLAFPLWSASTMPASWVTLWARCGEEADRIVEERDRNRDARHVERCVRTAQEQSERLSTERLRRLFR